MRHVESIAPTSLETSGFGLEDWTSAGVASPSYRYVVIRNMDYDRTREGKFIQFFHTRENLLARSRWFRDVKTSYTSIVDDGLLEGCGSRELPVSRWFERFTPFRSSEDAGDSHLIRMNYIYRDGLVSMIVSMEQTVGAEPIMEHIALQAKAIFNAGTFEEFEDGMETAFSKRLIAFVLSYGSNAVNAITKLLLKGGIEDHVAVEALYWLGFMKDDSSKGARIDLLETLLTMGETEALRDGALIGFSYMNDTDAIPIVTRAIEDERNAFMREDMQKVLTQLKRKARDNSSKTSR